METLCARQPEQAHRTLHAWSTVKAKVHVRLAISNNQSQRSTSSSTSFLITWRVVEKYAIVHEPSGSGVQEDTSLVILFWSIMTRPAITARTYVLYCFSPSQAEPSHNRRVNERATHTSETTTRERVRVWCCCCAVPFKLWH